MSFDKLEKEQITKSVGKRIQECRQKAGLTQEQLSEKSGISQKHISRIEQGYHDTHFTMIYVAHKLKRFFLADIFVERATEIVRYIVFSVRKRTCSAEA